ncbi:MULTISPECIES: hypothetical protein [Ruegeria]|uniref:TadE/TadG family type IV pilus assembly protein n=1 Tax=Ruegeria TaxID=97050 RepID=UPI001480D79C|nr:MULTISPECIES: hypothetical protein [Ruegeria]MBO9412947.1 hypothetical protein [Ruegeria sp. R8_1]MBO9416506.1 hypothetical protein [Ruegeria sp. R8_2]
MTIIHRLRNLFRSVKRDESGILTVEAILIFPMLVWTITGAFAFFDGFRQSAANLKAAYTVGDLISRETGTVTDTYVDSMHELLDRMVNSRNDIQLRISLIVYDAEDDRHYVRWSAIRGYCEAWTNDNIGNMRDNLPPMPDQDTLIIVETSNRYQPIFGSNWVVGSWVSEDHTFRNFVFTRPRFTNEIAQNLGPQSCSQA